MGIGVPGPVVTGDHAGQTYVNRCVNLGWGVKDVGSEMAALTGINRVEVINDANAAALGEIFCGSVQDMAEAIGTYRKITAVMVTIGTGVGGGIVRDGQVVRGAFGCCGEIGHIKMTPQHPFFKELRDAGSGIAEFEDYEYYASASGIIRIAEEAAAVLPGKSVLKETREPGAKAVFDAARAGDELALKVREAYFDVFGQGLATVASAIDPDVFIIGGGVSGEGTLLLEGIRSTYRKYVFHGSSETDFRLAVLGNDAGMIGCAAPLLQSGD